MNMQVSRTVRKAKSAQKKYRFVKGHSGTAPRKRKVTSTTARQAPGRNSIKKSNPNQSPANSKKARSSRKKVQQKNARPSNTLRTDEPGWADLKEARNNLVGTAHTSPGFLTKLSTVRFSLGILAVAALFTLYVGHVQATQDVLNEVYQAKKENFSLQLEYNRIQGRYDTATGPAVIFERARVLGLREQWGIASPVYVDRPEH